MVGSTEHYHGCKERVTMAAQSRLIKKYPNRRLYDTRTSTYITLSLIHI